MTEDTKPEPAAFVLELAKAALEKAGGERKLSRAEATAFLNAAGYPTGRSQLATLATRGGGPRYSKWGRMALYAPSDLLTWARRTEGAARRSTSEADVQPIGRAIGRRPLISSVKS